MLRYRTALLLKNIDQFGDVRRDCSLLRLLVQRDDTMRDRYDILSLDHVDRGLDLTGFSFFLFDHDEPLSLSTRLRISESGAALTSSAAFVWFRRLRKRR